MDKARKWTDKKLSQMEKQISKIYNDAYKDISKNWDKFMKEHYPKLKNAYNDLRIAKLSGDSKAIKDATDVYERTAKNITVNNRRFQSMRDEVSQKISHTNEVAVNYLNGNMASIYTTNYNAFGDNVIKGYNFSLTNEQAVKNLATKDKAFLPAKKMDIPKDIAWNEKMINSQMMQGILLGENIPKLSDRLMNVVGMNHNSAIRNARTMTTAAENKGRQDSFKKAKSDGVVMTREWIATGDDRTRAWHEALSGVEVGIDEPWENEYGEIMYPGDPSADPANVYNCRCSMIAHVEGFNFKQEEKTDENGLTLDEQREIASYKSADYYGINETLRDEGLSGLDKEELEKVRALDSALDKLPTYSGDVSRSLYFNNKEDLNDYLDGIMGKTKLTFSDYTSTTKGDKLYNSKGQVQMFIKNSTQGKDLDGYDNDEQEVLFKRNLKVNIVDQYWDGNTYVMILKERKK